MAKIEGLKRNYQFYIGIDCGVQTGLACWWKAEKTFSCITTIKIHQAMNLIRQWHNTRGGMLIRIEDARLRKWIPRQKNEKAEKGKREGAGSVKRDAKIWEDFLEDLGIDYELVPPKNNMTKVKSDYFMKITGVVERVSEHARDAAMLVYGL